MEDNIKKPKLSQDQLELLAKLLLLKGKDDQLDLLKGALEVNTGFEEEKKLLEKRSLVYGILYSKYITELTGLTLEDLNIFEYEEELEEEASRLSEREKLTDIFNYLKENG